MAKANKNRRLHKQQPPKVKESQAQPELLTEETQNALALVSPGNYSLKAATELNVSAGDIVNIVVAEFESRVKEQLTKAGKQIKAAEARLAELEEAAESKVKEYLAAPSYISDIRTRVADAYAALGLPCMFKAELHSKFDLRSDELSVRWHFYSKETRNRHYYGNNASVSYSDELEQTRTLTFAELGISDMASEYKKMQQRRDDLRNRRLAWQVKLGEIVAVEREARAKLTRATLQKTEGGQALEAAVMAQFDRLFDDLVSFDD